MNLLAKILPGAAAYPDIHPMLVHFPAALFPVALFFALLSIWKYPDLIRTSRALILLGTLGAIAAVIAGFQAEDMMVSGPKTLVSVHKSFMMITTILAILLSTFALIQWKSASAKSRWALLLALFVVNGVLTLGADRGALVALRVRSGRDLHLPQATALVTAAPTTLQADSTRGHELYAMLRCGECHSPRRKMESAGIPPTLEYAGSKMQADWMKTYLTHPYRIRWLDEEIRPDLRMPDYGLTDGEARDIAGYLVSLIDAKRFPTAPVEQPPLTPQDAEKGRILIGQYACKGCHSIGGNGNEQGPALDDVGLRLQPAWIFAFVRDPKGIISGTSMKKFNLSVDEARSITAYLMTLRSAPPAYNGTDESLLLQDRGPSGGGEPRAEGR
jgi:mono/diheme cytochrome c family protein